MKKSYGIVVIGGGPAGLAAAIKAFDCGERRVLIIERDDKLGGILNQCIHNGFGLTRFKESLTGPEYANRFILEAKKRDIEIMTGTTVLSLSADSADKEITAINPKDGVFTVSAKAVI
ncbi:MAG: FAD-dependent oxidoreductase, partial [Clostridiales bacterium]|nr:FAD-dependent oxidoreductase [Clostridiales bacterium]